MLKINTIATGLGLVLACGLASCNSKETPKVQDVYRAPAPKILKGNKAIDLPEWDRSGQKDLDLRDGIDVRQAKMNTVDVTARCRRGDRDFAQATTLAGNRTIALYQVIPEALLATDFNQNRTSCGLELVLRNEIGSKHIYNISTVTLRDDREGNLTIESPAGKIENPKFRFFVQNLSEFKVRSGSKLVGRAATVCVESRTSEIAFDNVASLSDFDFKPLTDLGEKPVQLCRVGVWKDGILEAISPVFEFQFPKPAPGFRALSLLYPGDVPNAPIYSQVVAGQTVPLAYFEIRNPSRVPRSFRISKKPLPSIVMAHFDSDWAPFAGIARPWLFMVPKSNSTANVREMGDAIQVDLAPGGSAQIEALFAPARPIDCINRRRNLPGVPSPTPRPLYFAVDFPANFPMDEVGEDGSVLATFRVGIAHRAYLGVSLAEANARFRPHYSGDSVFCNW